MYTTRKGGTLNLLTILCILQSCCIKELHTHTQSSIFFLHFFQVISFFLFQNGTDFVFIGFCCKSKTCFI